MFSALESKNRNNVLYQNKKFTQNPVAGPGSSVGCASAWHADGQFGQLSVTGERMCTSKLLRKPAQEQCG